MSENQKMKCDTLMVSVVQSQDAEVTENRLADEATSVTRLPSLGAFLGRRNATLLIGMPHGRTRARSDHPLSYRRIHR